MNYDIAIIIPTLNEEKFISRCINSILKQSFDFEKMDVMVVDGGSTDKTVEIVKSYQKLYKNIRLLENKKKIQSVAFNIGISNSDAPYIIRFDAHTTYDKEYISLCIKVLKEKEEIGNVGGRCIILPFNNTIWAKTNAILNHSRFGIGGAAFRVSNVEHETDSVPFGAFPRKVIDKIGGMREDLPRGEDNEYNSRIRKAGYKVIFNPCIISSYYARPTFKTSCKQMFNNGESIGYLYYIDKEAIGIRHLVPFLFVLCGIISLIISIFGNLFFYILVAGALLYFITDILASLIASKKNRKCMIPLFILFFFVHVSYGIGTIYGLIKGAKIQRN